MLREEQTANGKLLDLIFDGYRENVQADLREPRVNGYVIQGFLIFLQVCLLGGKDKAR